MYPIGRNPYQGAPSYGCPPNNLGQFWSNTDSYVNKCGSFSNYDSGFNNGVAENSFSIESFDPRRKPFFTHAQGAQFSNFNLGPALQYTESLGMFDPSSLYAPQSYGFSYGGYGDDYGFDPYADFGGGYGDDYDFAGYDQDYGDFGGGYGFAPPPQGKYGISGYQAPNVLNIFVDNPAQGYPPVGGYGERTRFLGPPVSRPGQGSGNFLSNLLPLLLGGTDEADDAAGIDLSDLLGDDGLDASEIDSGDLDLAALLGGDDLDLESLFS